MVGCSCMSVSVVVRVNVFLPPTYFGAASQKTRLKDDVVGARAQGRISPEHWKSATVIRTLKKLAPAITSAPVSSRWCWALDQNLMSCELFVTRQQHWPGMRRTIKLAVCYTFGPRNDEACRELLALLDLLYRYRPRWSVAMPEKCRRRNTWPQNYATYWTYWFSAPALSGWWQTIGFAIPQKSTKSHRFLHWKAHVLSLKHYPTFNLSS